jgi:hypothetical protein
MAELQAEAAADRLAAGAARAQKQRRVDGRLTRFARVLRLPSLWPEERIGLRAPRSGSTDSG